jgi:hypothetical protein
MAHQPLQAAHYNQHTGAALTLVWSLSCAHLLGAGERLFGLDRHRLGAE